MQSGTFNVVTDGQWGSCGKGLISTAIADRYRPSVISTTNMANAGHTAVDSDGATFIAKALPAPAILGKWRTDYLPYIVIGPTAAFHAKQMAKEVAETECAPRLVIHPRAGIITEQHQEIENQLKGGTKHVASTMQGCGAFLADKIMRRPDLKLAGDTEFTQYSGYTLEKALAACLRGTKWQSLCVDLSIPRILQMFMEVGNTILHEGSQGFSLDINHGSHYPQCTSRSTTAMQNMADMGITHHHMGRVILVIRPAPIRVGNVVEGGKTVGYSGDCYPDHTETTWEAIGEACGAPQETFKGELTTVTKRLRRVFTFSDIQFKEAVAINGATEIALNFANYIDWKCYGTNNPNNLPPKITDFIKKLEDLGGVKVTIVGTGPRNDHVCFLD